MDTVVWLEKQVRLPREYVERLHRLAQDRDTTEDALVERALELLFSLTDTTDEEPQSEEWSELSSATLRRVWDNDVDSVYDNWREIYGVPPG